MGDESDRSASSPMIEFSHCPRRGRDAIDALITKLSPWELMYLRKRARDVRTNAADFASFADLPSDIIVHIAEYFSPSDMLKCRLVSGGWRHVWMRNAVLKYYCRLNFPGLMELHGPSPDLEKLFLKTYRSHISPLIDDASRFVPWVAPKIERISESTNTVTYQLTDSDEVQPLSNAPIVKYCDGRVAWQTDWSSIWVDDLRSGQRTLCMLGNNAAIKRQRPQIKAMSSTLVIVSGYVGETVQTRVNRQLHIYHIKQKRWLRVSLPGGLEKCYTNSDVIAAVCTGGQVLVWRWDGFSCEVPVNEECELIAAPSQPSRRSSDRPGVLFHITEPGTIFLVWSYTHEVMSDSRLHTMVVVEYRHDAECSAFKPIRRYEKSIANPASEIAHANMEPDFVEGICSWHTCGQINSYGLYSLGLVGCIPTALGGNVCPCFRDSWIDRGIWTSTCFNVLTRTFTSLQYASGHPISHRLWRQQWNSSLYEQWYAHPRTDGYSSEKPVLYSYPACGRSEQWIPDAQGDTRPYTFEPFQRFGALCGGPHMMFIDDDFMVQAANHGYVFRSRSGEGPKHGWSNQPTSDEYTRNGHAEVEVRSRDANEQSLVYLPTHTTVVE